MKYLRFLVLLVLVSSCGSSKKVIDTPKTEPEIITDVKIDSVVMIKEDIAVKDVNIKNVVTDTVTITKNMKEERLVTNDSSGFHQELSPKLQISMDTRTMAKPPSLTFSPCSLWCEQLARIASYR